MKRKYSLKAAMDYAGVKYGITKIADKRLLIDYTSGALQEQGYHISDICKIVEELNDIIENDNDFYLAITEQIAKANNMRIFPWE